MAVLQIGFDGINQVNTNSSMPPKSIISAGILISSAVGAHGALVWHSALDGDAAAIVGQDGVATGTPTATTDMNGIVGGAVDFSGGNFFYEVDANPEITSLTAGSMSMWVRWNNITGEQGIAAMGQSGGGQTEYFTIMRQTATIVRTDLDDGDDGGGRRAANNNALSAGVWYHLVATFSAQGNVDLYVDGVLSNSTSLAGGEATIDNLNVWLIGTERTGARFLDGAMDDVRFYDNQLSDGEVTDLFNAGPLTNIPEPSTVLSLVFSGAFLLRRRRK